MTKQDKQLLLKDLSARLPYDVVVNDGNEIDTLKAYMLDDLIFIDEAIIKPYLRPLSSMTKEEKEIYNCFAISYRDSSNVMLPSPVAIDFLLSHHFDFRGLIEKSLAIVAPEYMYKNK